MNEQKLRNLNPDVDVPKLLQLRIEIEAVDQQGTDTSEAHLRRQFAWPNHDPSQDRWVIEHTATNMLIGYGWVFAQSPARSIVEVAIHPDWRRRGLGTQLLRTLIQHAKAHGASQIVAGARGNNEIGPPFLVANHFEPVGHNRFMTASADLQLNEATWPEGFTVQSYSEHGNLAYLAEGSNLCYADMWGHRENTEPVTVAYLQERMRQYPDSYFPEGIFVVFEPHNQVAGICFNRLENGGARRVIDSPGVAPAYRHLNLQRPLVQESMQWLSRQAAGDYHLYTWGDFESAVQIYHELGFSYTEDEHLIEYLLTE